GYQQRNEGQPEQRRQREHQIGHTEDRYRDKHGAPDIAIEWLGAQVQAHADFTHGHGAAQNAQALGADVQHIAGIDRQQSDHTAQQHGEQIQGNGAENDRPGANEMQPGGKALPAGGFGNLHGFGIEHRYAAEQQQPAGKAHQADRIGQLTA